MKNKAKLISNFDNYNAPPNFGQQVKPKKV